MSAWTEEAGHELRILSPELEHARERLASLGSALGWHGALSADVMLDRAPAELCRSLGFDRAIISRVEDSLWVPVKFYVEGDDAWAQELLEASSEPQRLDHMILESDMARRRAPLTDEVIGRLQGLLAVPDDHFVAVPLVVGGAVSGLVAVATATIAVAGLREVATVEQIARELGIGTDVPIIGYVFSEAWAGGNGKAVQGFLRAWSEAGEFVMRASNVEYHAPARIPDDVAARAAAVAVRVHEVLGLADLSRTDAMITPDGEVHFLEVNVSPGLTETSMFPMAVEAAGYDLGDVIARLLSARAGRAR